MLLKAVVRWNTNLIWQVTYKLRDGTTQAQWFKSEQMARDWAADMPDPVIERICYTASSFQKFGHIDDQIRIVRHSL